MNIDNVLAHAQQLMLNEGFWQKVDSSTPSAGGGPVKSREAKMFKNGIDGNVNIIAPTQQTVQEQTRNSKLPKAILESFQSMPPQTTDNAGQIQTGGYEGQIPYSFLEGINKPATPTGSQEKELPTFQYTSKPRQLNETVQTTQGGSYNSQVNSGIDYNYIKYLIDESIKAHLSSNVLNESADGKPFGLKIAPGNVIQFMDTKGNIYEGVLKLKKKKAQSK